MRIRGADNEWVDVRRSEMPSVLAWIRILDGDGDVAAAYLSAKAATKLRDALDRLLQPKRAR